MRLSSAICLRTPEVVLIRISILLAAILAVPAFALLPTAAAAPVDCVMVYDIPDVRRHFVCVDPKAACPVYTKTVSWGGTTTQCLIPATATSSADGCGAACLEECAATLWAVSARAGCTIAHQPYYFQTVCFAGDCTWMVISCVRYQDVHCEMHQAPPVEHCQPVVTGFELDTYVCVDTDAKCQVWYEHRFQQRCLSQFSTA